MFWFGAKTWMSLSVSAHVVEGKKVVGPFQTHHIS
eukprot:COSAG06_NODE_20784_length_781_cov_1.356305_2_plen_34_part_01